MASAIPDKDPKSQSRPKLAVKLRQKHIDIYNSTSTGHQVGGVSKPTSWRRSRTSKLQQQFRSQPPPALLTSARPATRPAAAPDKSTSGFETGASECQNEDFHAHGKDLVMTNESPLEPSEAAPPKIFRNCTIYINGTTAPAISDLVLKRHLSTHGAVVAAALLRKTVTHVILGKPSGGGNGAGGGLAAGKLQKEIIRNGGNSIKYVSVDWALDSIKAGKRLSENDYPIISLHGASQKGITGFIKPPTSNATITSAAPKAKTSASASNTKAMAEGASTKSKSTA